MNGALVWSAVLVALVFANAVALARETHGRVTFRTIFESADVLAAASYASRELRHKGLRALAKPSVFLIALLVATVLGLVAIASVNTLRGGA